MNEIDLHSVAHVITKGTTPSSLGRGFTSSGINFVKSESIGSSKYLNDSIFEYIDEETDFKLKRSRLESEDLLFSIAGAYLGKIAIVRKENLPANTNQAVGIVRLKKEIANADYVYYYFSQKHINSYINQLSAQSSQPNLNLDLLGRLKFRLREINEQKKIADVLSALDAKIELNNRINAELESLAKIIYDYWFVQFDFPNADGKPYKSSGGEMVYVENGKGDRAIPARWKVGKLGDIGKNIRNGVKETDIDPEMAYIGLEHIPRKQIALDSWSKAIDIASSKFSFVCGNILFGKLRPYFHKVGVSFISGVCSTDILVLDSKQENYFGYFLLTVSSNDFIHYVTLATEGTRMPRTNWEHMKNHTIPIPDVGIVKRFNEIIKPLISQMENNVLQNQQLTQLRDWLLPMLMNGQVRVK